LKHAKNHAVAPKPDHPVAPKPDDKTATGLY
jgi:hypothetical protein